MNTPEDREQFLMNYKSRAEEVDIMDSDSSDVLARSSNRMNKVAIMTGSYLSNDPDMMQKLLDKDIYKLILAASNFQKQHDIPDDIMKQIIDKIK